MRSLQGDAKTMRKQPSLLSCEARLRVIIAVSNIRRCFGMGVAHQIVFSAERTPSGLMKQNCGRCKQLLQISCLDNSFALVELSNIAFWTTFLAIVDTCQISQTESATVTLYPYRVDRLRQLRTAFLVHTEGDRQNKFGTMNLSNLACLNNLEVACT